jgi:aconitate hydratase
MASVDSLKTRRELSSAARPTSITAFAPLRKPVWPDASKLPVSMKVLLENLLRYEDGVSVNEADLKAVANWLNNKGAVEHEISFRPARVLMQDFTGVPAVVDLAAMRDAMVSLGADPAKINPLNPVDLVIDHSVMVDNFGNPKAYRRQRRQGIRAQHRALPLPALGFVGVQQLPRRAPGTGICHQVNLEYLARPSGPTKPTAKSPIPTPSSAPTATPPWSTACPSWAGAWAASRPRPPCWASRSRC